MKCRLVVLLAIALAASGSLPAWADDPVDVAARAQGRQRVAKAAPGMKPKGLNPFLSEVIDPTKVDYAGWRAWMQTKGAQRAAGKSSNLTPAPLVFDESEPADVIGSNDTRATAERVNGFGSSSGANPRARIEGTLTPRSVPIDAVAANREDDGSIGQARDTGIPALRQGIRTTGRIGDGPHGSAGDGSGDFDDYALRATAGQTIVADLDTITDDIDSIIVIYDNEGNFLGFNDDDGVSLDSRLEFRVPATGRYIVSVFDLETFQADPFDSGSGFGVGGEGPYRITISALRTDVDVFAVALRAGDVIGASVEGSARHITVLGPAGVERHGSTQDATFAYPASSPLPGGGNAVTDHVAISTGTHFIQVDTGMGPYRITVEVYRPALEDERPTQTLFLDFDGERLNTNILGGPGVRTLSPLSAFVGRWGLTNRDLNPLIDRIVAVVEENLRQDLINSGLNRRFRLQVKNSRDDADPWGDPNVSRVIVGGTISQSGLFTIGVAQSIDPGNFDQNETAVVLLDSLSEPAGENFSINTWLRQSSNRVRFVGQAVGNIVSHEAGHYFGNWHVDAFNRTADLMDEGGNPELIFGVGPDRIGGTGDDRDIDFGEDTFSAFEGFTGKENTKARVAFALTSD